MYKSITCKQTSILQKGSSLYHPDLKVLFTDEFRTSLSKESEKLTGIKSHNNCAPNSVTVLTENIKIENMISFILSKLRLLLNIPSQDIPWWYHFDSYTS